VTDRVRGLDPWLVMTGDSLLIGDAGRPDLHAGDGSSAEDLARRLHSSIHDKLLSLPDEVLLYPSHYSGSVCGRGLSANPASSVGFERRSNPLLKLDEDDFVAALLNDVPPAPDAQARIVAANRAGALATPAR
jgi:glyoxylase-like metal-dependent hydrolase (beta-lactamase superfamily II)